MSSGDESDFRSLRAIVLHLPIEHDHRERLLGGLARLSADRTSFALESFRQADAAFKRSNETAPDQKLEAPARSHFREYEIENYRNFGILAHIDAGKTTTTERILNHTGKSHKTVGAHDASTAMNRMEQEYGITINSAVNTTFWKGRDDKQHRFNIIETPGHVDFAIEVERSLSVLDGSIALLDANSVVVAQTEAVWRRADKHKVPRMIFVNKMDETDSDFFDCVKMIRERLGARPVVMQIPIGVGNDFNGVVDLVEMKAFKWKSKSSGAEWDILDIPAGLADTATEWRKKLVETAVEMDDSATVTYLKGDEPNKDTIRRLIRKGCCSVQFFPVLCGSALKNMGVQPLLDAVVDFLPSPLDVPAVKGIDPKTEKEIVRKPSDDEPLSMRAFKIVNDPSVGSLTFCRIYSGKLETGVRLMNSDKDKCERIDRVMQIHSNSREEVKVAFAGDIVAIVGLKETTTGDTLCDPLKPVVLKYMEFPDPVMSFVIEPKSEADHEIMDLALGRLAAEDPSLRVSFHEVSAKTIVAGMGELHLDIVIDRLHREFNVEVNVSAPQVAYFETITKAVEIDYTHEEESDGIGQFARVKIVFEPNLDGEDFVFETKIVEGALPEAYIASVQKGIESVTSSGPAAGFPMLGVKATLFDATYHDDDSSFLAFEIASRAAFREAALKAGVQVLEPIMKVEVVTPQDYFGDIIGDLNSRRGQIQGTGGRVTMKVVNALVPLSNMFGYMNSLRSMSQGSADYFMQFDHFASAKVDVVSEVQDGLSA